MHFVIRIKMLKEYYIVKIVIFLFALSVSSPEDYKELKILIFDKNGQTKSYLNKHSNLPSNNYDHDKSIQFVAKQRKYDELLEQLRFDLTLILSNPDYIKYLTNLDMPVYNIDVRPAEDFKTENSSLILRTIANSGKKNDKKASDSSDSSASEEKDKKNLRYGSCRRGRKICVKACKSAYRDACYIEYCWWSLRRLLRKYCKKSCRKWFS